MGPPHRPADTAGEKLLSPENLRLPCSLLNRILQPWEETSDVSIKIQPTQVSLSLYVMGSLKDG